MLFKETQGRGERAQRTQLHPTGFSPGPWGLEIFFFWCVWGYIICLPMPPVQNERDLVFYTAVSLSV